jgi:DNA-directed RNA polymerase beta subunit
MNVGQVFECLLGLAGEKLGNRFKVTRLMKFMERSITCTCQSKLKEAAIKTNCGLEFTYYPGRNFTT